ncbi:MAG: cbb3-type cytochrome oxidase assembly protein CcoS [Bacteroidetes bacterium]|nr:MAG: cbb3-type cytochrome oxidase assembly protein CcoS [Bacteroidota bacterium]
MGIIYLMLIVSLLIALFFLFSFLWATKSGQYDDDYSPSIRILFDDETKSEQKKATHGNRKV